MKGYNFLMDEVKHLTQANRHYTEENDRLKKELFLANRCLEALKYSRHSHLVRKYFAQRDSLFSNKIKSDGDRLQ